MYYNLITDLVSLVKIYEEESSETQQDVQLFVQWLERRESNSLKSPESAPQWKGKDQGRSSDSVINTTLVHLYRYAKLHAKAAIANSDFSTPDDFIYLISLVSFGSMTKTGLIKLNVHEKSAGMQIVNRLISSGFVEQSHTADDKRNRLIEITEKGRVHLAACMPAIKEASKKVTAPLSEQEKLELIRLLTKLEDHHEAKLKGE